MYFIVFTYKKQPHHLFSYIKLDFLTWAQNHLLRVTMHVKMRFPMMPMLNSFSRVYLKLVFR